MPSADAWARLGELLVQRRIEIAPRYRERTVFAEDVGIHWRMLHDIERAKRKSFTPETLAAIEVAYRWRPGSVARVLAGGDPLPIAGAPPAAPVDIPEDDPVLEYVRSLPGLSPQDRDSLEGVARSRGLGVPMRRAMVGFVLTMWAQEGQAESRSA